MKQMHNILYSITAAVLLLSIHRGYIALWHTDDPEPAVIFPYKAVLMPPKDRQNLMGGIKIENSTDLSKLLEDFLS